MRIIHFIMNSIWKPVYHLSTKYSHIDSIRYYGQVPL